MLVLARPPGRRPIAAHTPPCHEVAAGKEALGLTAAPSCCAVGSWSWCRRQQSPIVILPLHMAGRSWRVRSERACAAVSIPGAGTTVATPATTRALPTTAAAVATAAASGAFAQATCGSACAAVPGSRRQHIEAWAGVHATLRCRAKSAAGSGRTPQRIRRPGVPVLMMPRGLTRLPPGSIADTKASTSKSLGVAIRRRISADFCTPQSLFRLQPPRPSPNRSAAAAPATPPVPPDPPRVTMTQPPGLACGRPRRPATRTA